MSGEKQSVREALDHLARFYWKPIYFYLQLRWRVSPDEAQELTQGLFAQLSDGRSLANYDVSKGKLRTYLRRSIDHLFVDEVRRKNARKRGGDYVIVEFVPGVAEPDWGSSDPDKAFDQAWKARVVELARERLKDELLTLGKEEHLAVFDALHVDEPPSHEELAKQMSLSKVDVNNRLSYSRRAFRRIVTTLVRELTSSDEEYRDELASLGFS